MLNASNTLDKSCGCNMRHNFWKTFFPPTLGVKLVYGAFEGSSKCKENNVNTKVSLIHTWN